MSISIQDADSGALRLLVREGWLRDLVSNPGWGEVRFDMTSYNGTSWYEIKVPDPRAASTILAREFRPEVSRSSFTKGSPRSVALERPMSVAVEEVPRVEWVDVPRSNRNGTWTEKVPVPRLRLGISFTDVDTRGQKVTLNRSWLGTYSLTSPYFQDAAGKPILNTSDTYFFYLKPKHFSILYAFTTNEAFTKEDNGAYSNVFWDSVNRNIRVKADRQDPVGVDERFRSQAYQAPVVYDQTSSFTVRATWKITQKGHWQYAVPVFFMGASNDRVDMANSIYVIYASRDQSIYNPNYNPMFYLRYRDSAGTMKRDYSVVIPFATQYEFLMGYDGYTRTMRWEIYDGLGAVLASTTYAVGASETFSLGKVGAGAWGTGGTSEPITDASTDNLYFDANMARNGNFEADANWEIYSICPGAIGWGRSTQITAKFGTYTYKVQDWGSASDCGVRTVRMSAGRDRGYVASTWVWVQSGRFDLYLEFWNAMSGGTRLAFAFKSTTTTGQWEYLDLTMIAPAGTVAIDTLLYSSASNIGTAYFDGAELRLRRSSWAVNNHDADPTPPGGPTAWQMTFDRAAELGVSYVRTQVVWREFEPSQDAEPGSSQYWNSSRIGDWKSIIQIGKTRGIDLILILNGREPTWVTLSNVYSEFREFCQKIGQEFGRDIYYYQVLNEPNYNLEILPDSSPRPNTASLISNCFDGLLLGEAVSSANHKSAFKTIVNYLANWGDWVTPLNQLINQTGLAIDIPAIDHYPGTKTAQGCPSTHPDAWDELKRLFSIIRYHGREGALMETGFSTYNNANNHGQDDQETWVNCHLPFVRGEIKTHNLNYPGSFFQVAAWYELWDLDTMGGGLVTDELDHYGLLQSYCPPGSCVSYAEKLAYDDFRARVAEYTW